MLSRIPNPEISNLWHYLRSQRAALPEGLDKAPAITEPLETAEDKIKRLLVRYQGQYGFVPYESEPDKKTFSNKTASTELLAVDPGDFLGIFPGRLRYTDQKQQEPSRDPSPISGWRKTRESRL
ncbi:hypothetical protein BKA61DRAFT_655867 [Leptodontidium sp. MPI-SDFR-AT-0119]|nr:hypothetical protein BKA61DRAFT_655867 [Leptodontidium sp. MPI-SDFR-AT-0119]